MRSLFFTNWYSSDDPGYLCLRGQANHVFSTCCRTARVYGQGLLLRLEEKN